MMKNRLDVLGLCEMRWGELGKLNSGDYLIFDSGEEKSGTYSIGIIVGRRLKNKVVKINYISMGD